METSSSIFHRFSDLPFELRSQIWIDALPDTDGPAIFLYKKGCWQPKRVPKPAEEQAAEDVEVTDVVEATEAVEAAEVVEVVEDDLCLEFRYELLSPVEIEVQLAFVNHEARGVAQSWARGQGLEMRFCKDRNCHVFGRYFDQGRDTLYIPEDRWDDFCVEPVNRLFEPDLVDRSVTTCEGISQFAVPQTMFPAKLESLQQLSLWWFRTEVLLVVVDLHPHIQMQHDDVKLLRRWKISNKQGRWDSTQPQEEDPEEMAYIGDEALFEHLKEVNPSLCERLPELNEQSFRVWLTTAELYNSA
jgi:hypothetical protein